MLTDRHGDPSVAAVAARQVRMATLARAQVAEVEAAWQTLPVQPPYTFLRSPEAGLALLRARAGGTGQQFNMGEVSLARCTVRLAGGEVGVGYVLGRDTRHAELAAVFDAMLQTTEYGQQVLRGVIDGLAAAQQQRQRCIADAVADTRVEFFTIVRGDG